MDNLSLVDVKEIFLRLKKMSLENKDYLIQLDGVMGDGDLGLTMAALFTAAETYSSTSQDEDIGTLFMKSGMVMAKSAPSTMGTLMATGFMRGGKALKGVQQVGLIEFRDFWKAFVEGIMERGKSKPGEKTIIDSLYPVFETLDRAVIDKNTLSEACVKIKAAAAAGVESTKNMVAQHGRAAYYQEKSRTIQDAGATIGSMVIAVFADYVTG
jgi:phosphoenolpyruvate---glycerone phosphotransferase subunit DhaL